MTFQDYRQELENKIQVAIQDRTLEECETLGVEFLQAMMRASAALAVADKEARMHKSGLKAVKAAVYLKTIQNSDKKPTENALEHIINTDPLVAAEQDELDTAEVLKAELERNFDTFLQAQQTFRALAKGVQG